MVICPPTPEWKKSSAFDLNGEAVPDEDDDGGPGAPTEVLLYILCTSYFFNVVNPVIPWFCLFPGNSWNRNKITNDDVLGDSIPFDQQEALRHFCCQTLKLSGGGVGRQFDWLSNFLLSDVYILVFSHNTLALNFIVVICDFRTEEIRNSQVHIQSPLAGATIIYMY